MGEVGGEAVAEVDAGGGEAAAEEGLADGEAGLGEEVWVVVGCGCGAEFAWGGGEGGEFGGGAAEGAGDVEEVAGAGAGAAEGAACGGGAEEDDVGEDEVGGGFGGVAAGEGNVVGCGEGEEAVEEAVEQDGVCGRWISGRARERKAARGLAPMAARSLRPRARVRWPMEAGGCQARRKWRPSSEKSVVTRSSWPGGWRRMAQSSPMPRRNAVGGGGAGADAVDDAQVRRGDFAQAGDGEG